MERNGKTSNGHHKQIIENHKKTIAYNTCVRRGFATAFQAPLLYLVAVVAVVMMWRGLWGLLDIYLWPQNPKRSNWVSFIAGFILICIILFLLPLPS
jgi:hypothetical protein